MMHLFGEEGGSAQRILRLVHVLDHVCYGYKTNVLLSLNLFCIRMLLTSISPVPMHRGTSPTTCLNHDYTRRLYHSTFLD